MKYMRERKYVKVRVDMHEDTKFKIIDMKPERDVIHYVWNRIVLLAGKVNLEGELYLSKSIPYTIETLAIEFNRDIAQVKLALEVFIELHMVELTEDNVYKVTNFAKHQNIKVKEKEIVDHKGEYKESKDITEENRAEKLEEVKERNLESANKVPAAAEDSIESNSSGDDLQNHGSILLEAKKDRRRNKKKKDNKINNNIAAEEIIDEEVIDDSISCFIDGDRPLGDDESIVLEWSFG